MNYIFPWQSAEDVFTVYERDFTKQLRCQLEKQIAYLYVPGKEEKTKITSCS